MSAGALGKLGKGIPEKIDHSVCVLRKMYVKYS